MNFTKNNEHDSHNANQSYRSHNHSIHSLSPNLRLQKYKSGNKESKKLSFITKKASFMNKVTLNDADNSLVLNKVSKSKYRPLQRYKNCPK